MRIGGKEKKRLMGLDILNNNAVTGHALFARPFFKDINSWASLQGMRYIDRTPAVMVLPSGDVVFSYYAPEAETVETCGVTGSFKSDRISLEKQEDGWFRKRVSGIPKGFHYNRWFVDGVQVSNPDAQFYGGFMCRNFFDIPESEDDFYFRKEVPHGTVRLEMYPSSVTGEMKGVYIYTPPGYEKSTEQEYPALYIQHGVGENETCWIWNGKAHFVMDNLIAEEEAVPMIIVMNSGYAFREDDDPVFYPGDFDSELVYDCIPFIEQKFRVKPGRENRAIAGLSLGAAQASLSASEHPDLFGYLGIFSGASHDALDKIAKEKLQYGLIFLSAGTHEPQAGNLHQLIRGIQDNGIPTMIQTYEGYHEWSPWRKSLRDFASLIFREEKLPEYPSTLETDRKPCTASAGRNQALTTMPLFCHPEFKEVVFATLPDGRPAGKYRECEPGIRVTGPGTAVFSFTDPLAKTVEVSFGGRRISLEKDENGRFSAEVSDIAPGFWYTEFFVNGTSFVHPQAQVCYGPFKAVNFFEMEDPDFTDYLMKEVPHGSVRFHLYHSSVTDEYKPLYVYTPAGYDESKDCLPVIYLQHGGGEDEIGWFWHGKVNYILDNLIAESRMKPCLVAMACGYSFAEDGSSHPTLSAFDEEMARDIVPVMDQLYRTIPDRRFRAMAGLSMGAIQTEKIIMKYPELFANAGMFSGVFFLKTETEDYTEVLYDREKFESLYHYVFVGVGEEDGLYRSVDPIMQDLRENRGLPIDYFHCPGAHTWTFWRKAAVKFFEKVFQN